MMAEVAEPDTEANIGTKEPPTAALLADSGAMTPRHSLSERVGSLDFSGLRLPPVGQNEAIASGQENADDGAYHG